jgi:hypothetical protein
MSDRGRRWVRRLRARLRRQRRGRCRACGERRDLQFAHRRPTGLNGMGRGSIDRVLDVRRHPRSYVLLCARCHHAYDKGVLLPASRTGGWRCEIASAPDPTAHLHENPGFDGPAVTADAAPGGPLPR